jgi:phosphoglycolate phosphatase
VVHGDRLVVGFDLDMTLIDPRPGVAAAMTALETEIGAGIDVRWVVDHLGPPLETVLARWLPEAQVDRAAWRYRDLFEELGIATTAAMPGAVAAVKAVRDLGGAVLVVTAKYEPHARQSLRVIGVDADVVVGWRYAAAKAEALQAHRAHVYVGDHPADVIAARVAGVVGVMIPSGPAPAKELVDAGADVVLASLEDFPAWLHGHVEMTLHAEAHGITGQHDDLNVNRNELASAIYEVAHLNGTFSLRSGHTSSEYFDKFQFTSRPELLDAVSDALAALGGVPLAAALALKTRIPAV